MDETKGPQFTGHAKKVYRELIEDEDGSKMWKELKSRTPNAVIPEEGLPIFLETERPRIENEGFNDLRKLLKPEDWDRLVYDLTKIDLNDNEIETAPNADGLEVEAAEAFLELAADLKEFNPQKFLNDFKLRQQHFLDLKSYAETLRGDSKEFLKFAYDLKILFPSAFDRVYIPETVWQRTAKDLEGASVQKDREYFLQIYEQAHFVSVGNIQKFLLLGTEEWDEILSFINTHQRGSFAHARLTASAQALRPYKYKPATLSLRDWQGCVSDLKQSYKHDPNPWLFARRSRQVKYLKLGPQLDEE